MKSRLPLPPEQSSQAPVRSDRHPPALRTILLCALVSLSPITLTAKGADPIRFDRDVRPILSDKCFHCHGPDSEHREADLRLDLEDAAKQWAIVPGDAGEGEFVRRIRSTDSDEIMPPVDSNKSLTKEEQDILCRWIDEGAQWTQHWSFVRPQRPPCPPPSESSWPRNAIDHFIQARLEQEGLTPTRQADRTTLIRRLSYDLTGLPPTLQEIDDFLADSSADAYEKVVDRLLASKHYGERMAVMWLDAARYGDTSVYHADGPRDMWGWRDAIVNAYNDNMPFNRFSISQLAGDLVPEATLEQRVLAGFNRNNGTTDEGGAIAEEYRVEYAVDRVKTTSTVWLGLSVECAQCHDHKYDPISQEDYYRFFAFFNVSADKGMQTRGGNAEPTLAIPDPDKQRKLPGAERKLAQTEKQLQQHIQSMQPQFQSWLSDQETQLVGHEPLPSGATLEATFREGEGNQVADIANDDRRGTVQGKAEWIDTPFDRGLQFSGGNYVDFGDVGDFERTSAFSYGGWLKPQAKSTGALLARMDDANRHRGYDMMVVSDGPISVHIIHDWPGNAIKVTTKKKLKSDRWHHLFATYDGSSKAAGVKIYVNGEPWEWNIEQDGLTETIRTEKSLLVGSRHPGTRLKGTVDSVQVFNRQLADDEVSALAKADPVGSILALDAEERSETQVELLRSHFLEQESPEYQQLKKKVAQLKARITDLKKPLTTVMVMSDMAQPRETFVLNRGAYDSPTDQKVEPGTMAVLPAMANALPRNRLGLAQWLFSDDHPLTARVAVNRYWQMLFGAGLVSSPEDFGSQGEFPSHPELLDWLAVDFRENGWNVKRTLKQIVMSATYRQSSHAAPTLYHRDPANRLLARGPRFRLQAEFIRDTALSISGLLDNSLGGPGVKPYQPPGLWAEVGLGGNPKFKQDHDDKLYRRSLYTYWKRSAPPPSMQIFDAPTREKCTIRRPRTNTPLQALVVLNDPQFVEAARCFAERILERGDRSGAERVLLAFRQATARLPTETELRVLLNVYEGAKEQYGQAPEAAKELLGVGESPRNESLDVIEHAAWTIVASSILNLDETLTRE